MMLFFGAGASKPFGIPTMEEMSEEFENSTDLTKDERELYLDIENTIGSNNLEGILTVLNDLSQESPNPSVSYLKTTFKKMTMGSEALGPLRGEKMVPIDVITKFSTDLVPALKDSNLSKKLQSKIIKFIKKNCDLEGGKKGLTDIFREYNRLFEILKFNTSPIFDVFTTNYDLAIEMYHGLHFTEEYDYRKNAHNLSYHPRISFTDGFLFRSFEENDLNIKDGSVERVWDPRKYDDVLSNGNSEDIPTLRLFKLHGSIGQYYQNGEIVKKDILFPTRTIGGGELRDSMIYPMRAKEIYKDPFFELFTRLKASLLSEKICIVIGYSFGDEHIRNIFFDAVKRNPEIRLFMINPNAKKIRDDLEPIKDKIEPIEGKFGEESVFKELKQKLSEV